MMRALGEANPGRGRFARAVRCLRKSYTHEKRREDYRIAYIVGAVYRPVSFYLAAPFVLCGVSANQVTSLRFVVIAAGLALSARGGYRAMVLGTSCFFLQFLLDYADGDIARMSGTTSRTGALWDGLADRVGQILPPLAIAIGLARHQDALLAAWFPLLTGRWVLACGAAVSFATAATKRWKLAQMFEFLSRICAARPAVPAAPAAAPEPVTDIFAIRSPARLPRTMRNIAHIMEAGMVACAAINAVSAYLLFRLVYQIPRAVVFSLENWRTSGN